MDDEDFLGDEDWDDEDFLDGEMAYITFPAKAAPEAQKNHPNNSRWVETAMGAKQLRPRHDGFSPAKQKEFLRALAQYANVRDACRACQISSTAAYRTRRRLADFAAQWDLALQKGRADLEILAFDRAVNGVEEKIIRDGKVVSVKKKPSDSVFRMILQGSNPEKYGRMGAVASQQAEAKLRTEIEAEMKEKYTARASSKELADAILEKLEVLNKRLQRKGWIKTDSGHLIPPGWVKIDDSADKNGNKNIVN